MRTTVGFITVFAILFAGLSFTAVVADTTDYTFTTDIQKPAKKTCYADGQTVTLSTLTYPGSNGARWLLEGEVKIVKKGKQPQPHKITTKFVRWDGDATGAVSQPWLQGENNSTNIHITSGRGGREISFVATGKGGVWCVKMVQFKLIRLELK